VEGGRDGKNRGGEEGKVVSKSERLDIRETGEEEEKGVVGNDEEEGRKGASLLHPPFDINPIG
jgi:hypothetical protein